ncbi:DNA-directed RNA polymerase subunit A'' [archaeon SCG-AAA382B04]|nr:DNA-directed RNA polymerase subunit A'' [archaeon SCG-AAA382B04]
MSLDEKLQNYKEELPPKILKKLKQKAQEKNLTEKQLEEALEETEQRFEQKQVEYGEPVGTIAAQSIGEPGTQMSIDYEEEVIIKQNEEIKTKKIGEIIDNKILSQEAREKDEWEVVDISNQNYKVPSLTQDEKVEWKELQECSRHPAPEKILEIKTSSGRKIKATDSHSFLIRKNNEIKTKSGSELEKGDRIPSIKKLKHNCIQTLETTEYINQKWAKKKLPKQIKLDKEFGWFIGIYLAEGNCTKQFVNTSNRNQQIQLKIRKIAERFGFSYNEYEHSKGYSETHDVRLNSKQLLNLLEKTCGTGSQNKKIPEFAYSAYDDFVAALLRGYFDGNGNINPEKDMIRVSSRSKELINGISLLLNRLGIFSTKNTDKKQSTLILSHKNAHKFKQKIGFTQQEKNKEINQIKEKPTQEYIDMIPGTGELIKEISQKIGTPTRRINNFHKRDKIGRETLKKYIKEFKQKANSEEVEQKIKELEEAAKSEVIWDKITQIKEIKPTRNYVYDFSVKDTENFTTKQGIVTHNTMRTFHYAGVAEIDVTLGLPRLIEIVDARKTPSSPMMTIKLEEEYASDKNKAREIGWKIEETRLEDIADMETDFSKMRILINLDDETLSKKKISEEEVIDKVENTADDSVTEEGENYIVRPSSSSYREILRLVEDLKEIKVAGIEGISRVIIRKEGEEYTIYTEGSAFKEVLGLEGVDSSKTKTNDLHEVYDTLGIEGARRALINEATDTLDEQGLEVDIRHIMLVADLMTNDGRLRAIGRHGVSGEKQSVLARAAFEVTVNHLLDAGKRGERDELKGVPENVIVGQPIELGTGIVDLQMKEQEE